MSEAETRPSTTPAEPGERGSKRLVVVAVLLLGAALAAGVFSSSSGLPFDHPKVVRLHVLAALMAGVGFLVALKARPRTTTSRLVAATTVATAFILIGLLGMSHPHYESRVALPGLQAVQQAQMAYMTANGGYFDSSLECLVQPWQCVPAYPSNGQAFLEERLARQGRVSWWDWSLHVGGVPQPMPDDVSQTSITSFAYVATPHDPEYPSPRAFCVDSTGAMCFRFDGEPPVVTTDGACDLSSCQELN